ncbi:MAG: polysaccharide deacetylase family protein [Sphingobacteriales bacterium]|nr:polysaccharide deacetylase family protein [Sphingobacteriales bacterium]
MYFVRIPNIIKKLFPRLIWDLPNEEHKVYLTFDDGPHPEITPWILKQLKKTDTKATFFCLGEHVEKYPEILQQILSEGHRVGNHGYKHLNGWKTNDDDYLQDYLKGQEMLRFTQNDTLLFRPAYGKIKKSQIPNLKSQIPNAQIINWSLMAGDFDATISSEKVYSNLQRVQSGDIVVLHDNEKAWKHLQYCLPKFLEFCKMKNYSLNTIDL